MKYTKAEIKKAGEIYAWLRYSKMSKHDLSQHGKKMARAKAWKKHINSLKKHD